MTLKQKETVESTLASEMVHMTLVSSGNEGCNTHRNVGTFSPSEATEILKPKLHVIPACTLVSYSSFVCCLPQMSLPSFIPTPLSHAILSVEFNVRRGILLSRP
jgi:hypothetical protein